jgi:hypothetical protein
MIASGELAAQNGAERVAAMFREIDQRVRDQSDTGS